MEGVAMQGELEVGEEYQIIPSFVKTKGDSSIFSMQLVDNEDTLDVIQQYCNELNNDLTAVDPAKIGPQTLCIAKYGEDSSYYRGYIEKVDKELKEATIVFFDYGNTEQVNFQDIAQIPGMVRTFVPQSYLCDWKTSTKMGLRKLYDMQIDEVETTIKVLGKKLDTERNAMIYTVDLPRLGEIRTPEEIKVKRLAEAEIRDTQPALVLELATSESGGLAEAAGTSNGPEDSVDSLATAAPVPVTVTGQTLLNMLGVGEKAEATPPLAPEVALPEEKVSSTEQAITPADEQFFTEKAKTSPPEIPCAVNKSSSSQGVPPICVPAASAQRASNESRKSVTTDRGTMTVAVERQVMTNGNGGAPESAGQEAGDQKVDEKRVKKTLEEYEDMFRNDPEFIERICKAHAMFAFMMDNNRAD